MSDQITSESETAANAAAPSAGTTSPAPSTKPRETLDEAIKRITAQPMHYPPFKRHEAVFRGNVVVQILRAKLTKSENGKDMIIVEGVVKRTCKLQVPASQFPANNPEGWDAFAFGENEVENQPKAAVCSVPVLPGQSVASDGSSFWPATEGQKVVGVAGRLYQIGEHFAEVFTDPTLNVPLLDENGQPQIGRHFPPLGAIDVTGYRFTYGDELTMNPDGTFFWRTERLINNVTFLGWRPGRVVAPRTGGADESLTDFVPDEDSDWVPAELLGMTGEFGAYFEKEEVKEDSKFAPRIMLVNFKLLDTRVTKVEAQTLSQKFGGLLKATRDGTKYDGRKVEEAKQRAATKGGGRAAPVAGARGGAAGAADAQRVASAPAEFCGKPCGQDKDPCMERPGHDVGPNKTACKPAPF